MAELLRKPRIGIQDLTAAWPEMVRLFPATARYYLRAQNFRICYVFQDQQAYQFLEAVKNRFGSISPHTIRAALEQAITDWISRK